MPKAWWTTKKRGAPGFTLAEILVSIAVFGLVVVSVSAALVTLARHQKAAGLKERAVFLAEEGLEAVRNIRDASFSNLSEGNFGISSISTPGQWSLVPTQDAVGNFTRQINITTVNANQKQAVVTVSWQQGALARSVSVTGYLTNWQATENISDWSTTTLASTVDLSGNIDGRKIQVAGNYAYIIRNGSIPDFFIYNISNPASPLALGTLDLAGTPQNIFVAGNYAYVASDNNNQELQIIDISNPSLPSVAGTYNATGNADALGVFANGSTVYLVRSSSGDNEFIIVNTAVPAAPTLVGSLNLGATAYEVVVSGNYAYIASGDNSQELQVIDISLPTSPFLSGPGINLSGNTNAITIAIAGVTVFIGQGSTLYAIDVTSPILPAQNGSLDVSDTLNDIALNLGNANTYLFVATSHPTNEFKVINVANPTLPVILGQRDISGNNSLLGVAYALSLDRAFVVGQSNTAEFMIIAPQ